MNNETGGSSPTDPYANTASWIPGILELYLWFACSDEGGMAAAEFKLSTDNPANIILAFTPQSGYLNAGSPTDLLLAVGGCPTGPILAGNILVLTNVPGEYCLVPDFQGIMGTVDCGANPQIWPIQQIGFSDTGSDPSCNDDLCPDPTSTEGSSWGGVKTLFR